MDQTRQEQAPVQFSPMDEEGPLSIEFLSFPPSEEQDEDEPEEPLEIITHADAQGKNSLPADGILFSSTDFWIPNVEQHHSILYKC